MVIVIHIYICVINSVQGCAVCHIIDLNQQLQVEVVASNNTPSFILWL